MNGRHGKKKRKLKALPIYLFWSGFKFIGIVCHSISCQLVAITHKISHFIIYHYLTGMHKHTHKTVFCCLVIRHLKYGNRLRSHSLFWMNTRKKPKQTKKQKQNKWTPVISSSFPLISWPYAHCFSLTHCVDCVVCLSVYLFIFFIYLLPRIEVIEHVNEQASKQAYERSESKSHEKSCKFIFIRNILHN